MEGLVLNSLVFSCEFLFGLKQLKMGSLLNLNN